MNRSIRNITLQKGKSAGSLALSKVINEFNRIYKKNVVLIFDEQKGVQEFEFIKVAVSRPQYSSSDDYLVEIGHKMSSERKGVSMFVTSDNKLL